MLVEYIKGAMDKAVYKILEDDLTFYGEIPGFQGVWANATTLEACRDELQERLEEWLIIGIRLGHQIPLINEIDLNLSMTLEEVA